MKELKNNVPIKNWAEDDRPREKFMLKGRSALSNAELIAIQLGSGNNKESALELAKRILSKVENNLAELSRYSIEELTAFKGVGVAKAINILSAIELGRRRRETLDDKIFINSSSLVYEQISHYMIDLNHEEFWCVFLNAGNKILKIEKVSEGGINSTVVDKRKLLKRALLLSSTSIILSHNHPSGNLKPSHQDITLTKELIKAAGLLDISVLDHIIIGGHKYFSFADEGII